MSSEVVGNLLKKSLKINYLSKTKDERTWERGDHADIFFRRWMWTMFLTVDNTHKQILKLYENEDEDNSVDESINVLDEFGEEMWDTFSQMAQDELKKIQTDFEYDPYESLFFQ